MKTFYAFKNEATDTPELTIFNEVGFWGDSAKGFYNQLKGIKAEKIKVMINSPGGSVVDGYAIYNMLRAHPADIEVHIVGIAASIASVIAMAGDKICMPENSLMFIHQPLVGIQGNAEEHRKVADDLDKLSEGIMNIYMARSHIDRPTLQRMMDEETLLTAKEAKRFGMCDEVIPEMKAAAKADFKVEDHFSKELAAKISWVAQETQLPPITPTGGQEKQPVSNTMTPEEKAELDAAKAALATARQKVAALEADNALATQAASNATTTAHQTATTQVKAAEKSRKDGIQALAAKFDNKSGDLAEATVKALAAETTVEEFKAQVMDILNERPTKAAIKQGGETGDEKDFGKKYEACKTFKERQALLRANPAEAKKYLAANR